MGLSARNLGDGGSHTTVLLPPPSLAKAKNIMSTTDDLYLHVFSIESKKLKRYENSSSYFTLQTNINFKYSSILTRVLIDAKASLPASGQSIQVAAIFRLESAFASSEHSMVMSETHWDRLWEVEIDPMDLYRRVDSDPKLKSQLLV